MINPVVLWQLNSFEIEEKSFLNLFHSDKIDFYAIESLIKIGQSLQSTNEEILDVEKELTNKIKFNSNRLKISNFFVHAISDIVSADIFLNSGRKITVSFIYINDDLNQGPSFHNLDPYTRDLKERYNKPLPKFEFLFHFQLFPILSEIQKTILQQGMFLEAGYIFDAVSHKQFFGRILLRRFDLNKKLYTLQIFENLNPAAIETEVESFLLSLEVGSINTEGNKSRRI